MLRALQEKLTGHTQNVVEMPHFNERERNFFHILNAFYFNLVLKLKKKIKLEEKQLQDVYSVNIGKQVSNSHHLFHINFVQVKMFIDIP